ncbi:unnamed protein product [Schistosoma rodhaini]|uniref:Metalloprotease TIKI homolog n=2 Tax=Schistosoma rodhaini TaxID=6188 RepID=A0AA85ENN1_9TREM|nr:unnamed protein product [Schistosoma rodhaini]CAH8681281.1 unnamed protein product [Schistosoma rodhaini]
MSTYNICNMNVKPASIQKCKHMILFLLLSSLFQPLLKTVVFFNSNVYFVTGQIVNIPHKFNYQFSKSFSTSIKPRKIFYQPLIISFISKLDYNSEFKRRQTRSISVRSLTTSNKCPQSTSKQKNTFLWKISTKPTSFLFGTLHVAYTHVWSQIDPVVKASFAQSDIVYFELDLTNPVTLAELSDCQVLPKNQTITNLLKPDLIKRLDRYINNLRHTISAWIEPEKQVFASYLYETLTKDWKEKRPIWLLLLLNSLTRSEIFDRGVPVLDLFLAQEAQRLGKQHGAVEQVNDQCEPLNRINVHQVTFALEITLNNLENANHPMKHLTNHFNNVNHIGHVSHNSSNNKKYTSNTKVLFNTWNRQINDTLITNQKRRPIQQTDVFNSPTEQLIEHYNCGDLNETLTRMSLTQTTPSDSALLSTSSLDHITTKNETNTMPLITMIRKNATAQQLKFSNKVNNISKRHNYRTQSLPSSQSTPSYFIDKEIKNLLSPSEVQTLIDLEKYLNEELIVRRNERMAYEIISKLKLAESLNQSAFFALGAAHFIGSGETIIDHLRKAGYIIIPVPQQNTIRSEERIGEISEEPLKLEKFNKISKTLVNYDHISTSNMVKQSSKLLALETNMKYSMTKTKRLQQLQHTNKHNAKNQESLQLLVSASNRLQLKLAIRTNRNIITNQCILFYTAYILKLF